MRVLMLLMLLKYCLIYLGGCGFNLRFLCMCDRIPGHQKSMGREIQSVNRGGQAMGHAHVANRDSRLPRGSPARPSPRQDHRERSAV